MAVQEFDFGQCLERVRRDDQQAARALVEALYPLVIRIVRGHLPEAAAEEDLAQEVFLKLFARLPQYQPRAGIPFEHWVSRLAVRTCLDALRAKGRRPEVRWSELPDEQQAWLEFMVAGEAPAPDAAPAAAHELLDQLLAQLPPEDRWVIRLLDLEQLPVKEIARRTGWSRALVKVRAFRARRKLRRFAEDLRLSSRYEEL